MVKTTTYTPSTFGSIISALGGQATGLIGIVTVLLGGYQDFSYNKSAVKQFYNDSDSLSKSSIDDEDDEESDEIKQKMRERLKLNSDSLTMFYCTHTLIWLLQSCCCCFVKLCKCEKEGSWYKRQLLRKKRLDLAVLKMKNELSVLTYLTNKRLTHLAFKTWFSRS